MQFYMDTHTYKDGHLGGMCTHCNAWVVTKVESQGMLLYAEPPIGVTITPVEPYYYAGCAADDV